MVPTFKGWRRPAATKAAKLIPCKTRTHPHDSVHHSARRRLRSGDYPSLSSSLLASWEPRLGEKLRRTWARSQSASRYFVIGGSYRDHHHHHRACRPPPLPLPMPLSPTSSARAVLANDHNTQPPPLLSDAELELLQRPHMVDLAKGMLPYLRESHERVLPWAQPDAGVEEVAYAARMVRSRALRFERCAICH